MNKKIINGIFVFIALIIFGFMVFFVDDFAAFKEKSNLYVLFDNIDALNNGALVYFNGVNCGSVDGIEFYDRKVKVRLSFKKDVPLNDNIEVSIKTGGLVGEKYIDIVSLSEKSGRKLKNGEVINGNESYSFDRLLISVNKLSDEMRYTISKLNNMMDVNEGNINSIFSNLKNSSESTNVFIKNLNSKVSSIGNELERFSKNLNDSSGGIAPELKNTLINAKKVMGRLDKILEVVESKKEVLGKSFDNFEKITGNLKNTTLKINKIVNSKENNILNMVDSFNSLTIETNYSLTYSDNDDKVYSDFYLNFNKVNGNFFDLGVKKIGFENDFNLKIGQFLGKYNYVFGGVLNSKPGVGLGYSLGNYSLELYNSDINENLFNLQIEWGLNDSVGAKLQYIDVFDNNDLEFSLTTKM